MNKLVGVVMGLLVAVLVVCVHVSDVAAAVNCNPLELRPCLEGIIGSKSPSAECCKKLKEQSPCLCGYRKNPSFSEYVNSPGAKKVATACALRTPKCSST